MSAARSTRQEAGKQVGHHSILKMQGNIVSYACIYNTLDYVFTCSKAFNIFHCKVQQYMTIMAYFVYGYTIYCVSIVYICTI